MQQAIEARFAICVLRNRDDQLLLVRRSHDRKLGPGRWGFPGGHIEAGESPGDCAWRELGEEIGSDHRVELIRSAGPFRDRHYGGRFEAHLFLYHWHAGAITLDDEHIDYCWVSIEDMRDYSLMPGIDEDLAHLDLRAP